jgi:L-aminoadipate-semialdehyde dehydrogenase
MPLTPNGKVDKNALPYPDTVVSSTTENAPSVTMSPLETHLVRIWSETLFPPRAPSGAPARTIGLDENFFDLGGHSILATRLVFQVH